MEVILTVHYSSNLSLTGQPSMIRIPWPPESRETSYMLAAQHGRNGVEIVRHVQRVPCAAFVR